MKRKHIILFISILAITTVAVSYKSMVYHSMKRINHSLGVSEVPPVFMHPAAYYKRIVPSLLHSGMPYDEAKVIFNTADSIERETQNDSTIHIRYYFRIFSLPAIRENDLYVYVTVKNGQIVRYWVDNS
jgi:hypothetical protein